MACQPIECKGNCSCCKKSLKISSMSLSMAGDSLDIIIPPTPLMECQPICIFLEQQFPEEIFNARITVLNAPDMIPVLSKCGRHIRIDTNSPFNILRVRYFTDPKRMMFCQFGIRNSCC